MCLRSRTRAARLAKTPLRVHCEAACERPRRATANIAWALGALEVDSKAWPSSARIFPAIAFAKMCCLDKAASKKEMPAPPRKGQFCGLLPPIWFTRFVHTMVATSALNALVQHAVPTNTTAVLATP
eukprot:1590925-Prymnesium_polylepis.1